MAPANGIKLGWFIRTEAIAFYMISPPTKIICRDEYCPAVNDPGDIGRFASQPFGVNWAPFSYLEVFGVIAHDGIDIAVPVGTPVYAAHDGIVVEVDNTDDKDGLGIELYDDVQKLRTIYWHNSANKVSLGQRVKQGDVLALSGGTGKAYGPHVHFGLYLTNANGQVINRDNGYRGAIDPMLYLVSQPLMTEKEVRQLQALEGYSDEAGVTFWTGKPLSDYLAARLLDKIKTLQANV